MFKFFFWLIIFPNFSCLVMFCWFCWSVWSPSFPCSHVYIYIFSHLSLPPPLPSPFWNCVTYLYCLICLNLFDCVGLAYDPLIPRNNGHFNPNLPTLIHHSYFHKCAQVLYLQCARLNIFIFVRNFYFHMFVLHCNLSPC